VPAVASTRTAITGIPAVPDLIWTSFRAFGTFGALLVTRQDAAEAALDSRSGAACYRPGLLTVPAGFRGVHAEQG